MERARQHLEDARTEIADFELGDAPAAANALRELANAIEALIDERDAESTARMERNERRNEG